MGEQSRLEQWMVVTRELVGIVEKAVDAAVSYQKAVGGKRKLGITGEVGEVLVCKALGLRLMREDRSAGFDALDAEGKRVQIKTRRSESKGLPRDVGRVGTFSKHEFDYAVLAILDYEYKLCEVWRADYKDITPVIERQRRRNPRLSAFKKVASQIFPLKRAGGRKIGGKSQIRTKGRERSNKIRGGVENIWKQKGRPEWTIEQTLRVCMKVDDELLKRGLTPAPKFRAARLGGDRCYLKRWIRGCRFEWV